MRAFGAQSIRRPLERLRDCSGAPVRTRVLGVRGLGRARVLHAVRFAPWCLVVGERAMLLAVRSPGIDGGELRTIDEEDVLPVAELLGRTDAPSAHLSGAMPARSVLEPHRLR